MQTIYEGRLKNIPPEIALHNVSETGRSVGGRSVGNNCPCIRVKATPDPEEMRRELKETCEKSPELAEHIESFLSASDYGQKMAMSYRASELIGKSDQMNPYSGSQWR